MTESQKQPGTKSALEQIAVESQRVDPERQFGKPFEQKSVSEIQKLLRESNNRNEVKSAFIVLSRMGQLRWDDIEMWSNLNQFVSAELAIPIPKNGNPYSTKSETDKRTGFDFLENAVDSLWGKGQYNEWTTRSKTTSQASSRGEIAETKPALGQIAVESQRAEFEDQLREAADIAPGQEVTEVAHSYANREDLRRSRLDGVRGWLGEKVRKVLNLLKLKGKVDEIAAMKGDIHDDILDAAKNEYFATTDKLNGVSNRDEFDTILDGIISEYEKANVGVNIPNKTPPCCVAILDIDFFKKVNDTYGHAAGDAVLKEFARRINTHIRHGDKRKGDLFARYGEEEFAVVLMDIKLDDAVKKVDELRKIIEAEPFVFDGKEIAVTMSAGVASYDSKAGTDQQKRIGAMFKDADKALFSAKGNGRNKVHVADRELKDVIPRAGTDDSNRVDLSDAA